MKFEEAKMMLEAAQKHLEHMRCYLEDSLEDLGKIEVCLADLEETF